MTDIEYVLKLSLDDICILLCIVSAGCGILGFIALMGIQVYEQFKIKLGSKKNV